MTNVNIKSGFSLNDAVKPKKITSSELLKKLLENIKPKAVEGFNQKHQIVMVIDNLLQTARRHKWNLSKENSFIFLYNGEYWNLLDEDILKDFISDVSIKTGVSYLESKHFEFKDKLFKQFLTASRLSTPENNKDVLINLLNGTFVISENKQKLREFKANDFLKYQLQFEYDENAKAPLFEKFLNEVLPDQNKQKVLAEYIGYVFTKHNIDAHMITKKHSYET